VAQGARETHVTGTRSNFRRVTSAEALFLRHIDWFSLDDTMGCTVAGGLLELLLEPLHAVSLLPYIPKDGVFVRSEEPGRELSQ
jgi:hypothetical protein